MAGKLTAIKLLKPWNRNSGRVRMLSALIPELLADPDFELPERVASRFFNSEISPGIHQRCQAGGCTNLSILGYCRITSLVTSRLIRPTEASSEIISR